MFSSLSLVWSSFATAVLAADLPQQLFSPLITSKVSATANLLTDPPGYPQWTDAVIGKWSLFPADTWTSGFFPATLYEMNRRKVLSGGLSNGTDWLKYARAWSVGLTTQENVTHVGHDVGFLSFPFVEELAMWVFSMFACSLMLSRTATPKIRTLPGLSMLLPDFWHSALAQSWAVHGAGTLAIPTIFRSIIHAEMCTKTHVEVHRSLLTT